MPAPRLNEASLPSLERVPSGKRIRPRGPAIQKVAACLMVWCKDADSRPATYRDQVHHAGKPAIDQGTAKEIIFCGEQSEMVKALSGSHHQRDAIHVAGVVAAEEIWQGRQVVLADYSKGAIKAKYQPGEHFKQGPCEPSVKRLSSHGLRDQPVCDLRREAGYADLPAHQCERQADL